MAQSCSCEACTKNIFRFRVPDMDCPVEEGEIRSELEKLPSVLSIKADTAARTLEVTASTATESDVLRALKRAGHPGEALAYEVPEAAPSTLVFSVPDMDCPVEENEIREEMKKHGAIPEGHYDTKSRRIEFRAPESVVSEILEALRAAGHPGTRVVPSVRLVFSVPDMDCPVEENEIREEMKKHEAIPEGHYDTKARTVMFDAPESLAPEILEALRAAGHPGELRKAAPASSSESVTIYVPEMDCGAEEAEIRGALAAYPDIPEGTYDTSKRSIVFPVPRAKAPEILEIIRKTGFDARLAIRKSAEPVKITIPWKKLGIALALALAAEFVSEFLPAGDPLFSLFGKGIGGLELFGMALALVSIALSGVATLRRGLISFAHLKFNMAALMALAVTGAFLTGNWPEAAMVMALFEISEAIEQLCLEKSRNAVKSLLSIVPKTAVVFRGDAWKEVPAEEVSIGDTVRVMAGERISLDGTVLRGESSADESMITGEPVPAAKRPGSDVYAGTVNTTGVLEIRVTAPATDTMAARIIASVEEAELKKAPVQRFVDRFALYYTPVVFAAALLTALVPPLFLGGEWLGWIYKGLVLLVIGCPCALVISTPVTIVSSLACAAREGIIVKGGVYLEEGRKLLNVALDKTGTITPGRPACTDVIPLGAGVSREKALSLASSLSQLSDHPVSTAITQAAREEKAEGRPAGGLTAIPGAGVSATLDGATLSLVSPRAVKNVSPALKAAVSKLEGEGKTVSVLADFLGPIAAFGVSDAVKSGVADAISDMKAAGMTPWMLTGDNEAAARAVAASAGISHVRAKLLPEEKLKEIESLRKSGITAMAGDGINDAPALAASDIGFAMGAKGTDTALEAASVMLMDDNIGKIAFFKRLAERNYRFLVANITFAIAVKLLFAALDLAGLATMWMAVFADTGVTLIVVANGMRMLRAAPRIRAEIEAARGKAPSGKLPARSAPAAA